MIRQLDNELYRSVCEWWDKSGFTRQDRAYLPSTSYVTFSDTKPVFFMSLYHDSGLGVVTWPTANPDSTFEERESAVGKLLEHIGKIAKELKLKVLLTGTTNQTLVGRLTRNGFGIADQNVTHLFKEV